MVANQIYCPFCGAANQTDASFCYKCGGILPELEHPWLNKNDSDFITLLCPKCGGKLQVERESDQLTCQYCGLEHLVRQIGNKVILTPVVESIQRVEGKFEQILNSSDRLAAEQTIQRQKKEMPEFEFRVKSFQEKYNREVKKKPIGAIAPLYNRTVNFKSQLHHIERAIMKPIHFTFIFILCFFSLTLAGCSTAATTTPEVFAPTATKIAEPTVNIVPTKEIIPTQVPQPTEPPPPTETPEPIACTIAFESNRDGNWEIYHMAPDGKDLRNLTNHPADDMQPALSGDGRQVAFISNRETEECAGQSLYAVSVDGSNLRQLSKCIWANFPDWSSDGKWITFSADGDIFIVPADGTEDPINLTNSPEQDDFAVVSPDNQKIAFLSGGSQNWNVFIMDIDGGQPQQLTSKGGEIGIDWSEDGRIVVVGWDRGDQGCCNFVMNRDGSDIMQAGGKGEMQKYLPFWTSDGNRVECVSVNLDGNNEEVYLVGEMFPDIFFNLTNHPADDRNPSWPAQCGKRD